MAKTDKKSTKPAGQFQLDIKTAPVANPRGVESVYSNNATLLVSAHDVRMIFAEVVSSAPFRPPVIELRANVTMSPTQFKAFAEAVEKTLVSFEKANGEIPWPPKNR